MIDEPLVVIEALCHAFPGAHGPALDDISARIMPGMITGLVGPDGAGKTTLLRLVAGLLRPGSGRVAVLGHDMAHAAAAAHASIGYMPQRFGLYEDLSVAENLDLFADLHAMTYALRVDRVDRLLRFTGLGPFTARLAGQLSGGMKQKLSLCCALIHTPEILLLDEPTFGVDPISRRDLWLILHEMVAQGVTVLVSTAYMDEAERCDHVALLDKGRVVALDTPAALQHSLAGQVVALRASDPRAALKALRALGVVRRAALFGDTIHVSIASRARDWPAVEAALAAARLEIIEAVDMEPSLEDVFIERVSAGSAAV
jgi:ABC-2 type transport system ATP-binding protein